MSHEIYHFRIITSTKEVLLHPAFVSVC